MKKCIVLAFITAISFYSQAQSSREIGACAGFSGYLGDLKSADISFRNHGLAFGMNFRENLNEFISLKGFVNWTRIQASDTNSTDPDLLDRNLSFRSNVLELGIQAEYNILPFDNFNPYRNRNLRFFNFTPYIFAGINFFRFNPKAYYQGSWVALQPLRTEGQNTEQNTNRPYSRTQVALPFGGGMKFQLNRKTVISFEIGLRKTSTDYLDDVSNRYPDLNELETTVSPLAAELSYRGDELPNSSQTIKTGAKRGNPSKLDWYMINSITLAYKIYR